MNPFFSLLAVQAVHGVEKRVNGFYHGPRSPISRILPRVQRARLGTSYGCVHLLAPEKISEDVNKEQDTLVATKSSPLPHFFENCFLINFFSVNYLVMTTNIPLVTLKTPLCKTVYKFRSKIHFISNTCCLEERKGSVKAYGVSWVFWRLTKVDSNFLTFQNDVRGRSR
jgi:hypothetical protein